jgi:iron complex transport system ATP-binding protein
MPDPILEVRDLSIGYEEPRRPPVVVASGITLAMHPGEFVCLLGPNGAGKSTLLRTLAGMQSPLQGAVKLQGRNIHAMDARDLARMLSVVLTERVTVGLLSAYELVSFGRYPFTSWSGVLTEHDHRIVARSIEAVGAEALSGRQVSELSDGERQKVMLARALAQEPSIMILDEITAFLDLPRRVEIMHILRNLAHLHGRAILISTHDLELALRTADSVWLMAQGEDLRTGAPEDLVLSGAFASVFAGEGIEFNDQLGSFQMPQKSTREIELRGTGIGAIWTARALERRGFKVMAESVDCSSKVSVSYRAEVPIWTLLHQGGVQEFLSVREVLSALSSSTCG